MFGLLKKKKAVKLEDVFVDMSKTIEETQRLIKETQGHVAVMEELSDAQLEIINQKMKNDEEMLELLKALGAESTK